MIGLEMHVFADVGCVLEAGFFGTWGMGRVRMGVNEM